MATRAPRLAVTLAAVLALGAGGLVAASTSGATGPQTTSAVACTPLPQRACVAGTVSTTGIPATDVSVEALRWAPEHTEWVLGASALAAPDGTFAIPDLAPGAIYTLRALSSSHVDEWLGGYRGPWPSRTEVTSLTAPAAGGIANRDIILTQPLGRISGSLTGFGGAEVFVTANNVATGSSVSVRVPAGNTTFTLPPSRAGVYWVRASAIEDPTLGGNAFDVTLAAGGTTTTTVAGSVAGRDVTFRIAMADDLHVGAILTPELQLRQQAPAGLHYRYYWSVGYQPSGNGASLRLTPAALGQSAHLLVIATAPGRGTYSALWDSGGRVLPTRPGVTVRATLAGKARAGHVLTAEGAPAGWTTTYQWFRDSRAITGATHATYRLVAADVKRKIGVRLTATRPGWTESTGRSATLAPRKAAAKVKAKLLSKKVNRRARAKVRVTVKAPGLTVAGKVILKDRKKKIARGKLSKKGKTVVRLARLKPGKHKITVQYRGSASVAKKSTRFAVRVAR